MKKNVYCILLALISVNCSKHTNEPDVQEPAPNYLISSIYFTDAKTGYAVGSLFDYPFNLAGSILVKTTDGGINWINQNSSGEDFYKSVFFTDSASGHIVGHHLNTSGGGYISNAKGVILNTVNAGANWVSQYTLDYYFLRSVFFTNTDTGYSVGEFYEISQNYYFPLVLKTTDKGITWTIQYFNYYNYFLCSVFFTDADTGYVVGNRGIILKTTNGGTSWEVQSSGTVKDLYSVYFTDATTGYAVGGSYESGSSTYIILRTTNGGENWYTMSSGPSSRLHSVVFTDSKSGYAVGQNGTILKTTNGGTIWTNLSSGTTNDLTSVFFTDANTGYAAGYNNTVLKTTNGGSDWKMLTFWNGNH